MHVNGGHENTAMTCDRQPGLLGIHDWEKIHDPREPIVLKSGKTKRFQTLKCKTCKSRLLETYWILDDRITQVEQKWKWPALGGATT